MRDCFTSALMAQFLAVQPEPEPEIKPMPAPPEMVREQPETEHHHGYRHTEYAKRTKSVLAEYREEVARLEILQSELLEALERLVTEIILSDVDMEYIDSHFMPHIEKARTAITKATGGAA